MHRGSGTRVRFTLPAMPTNWRPICDVPPCPDFASKSYLRPGLLRQLGLWTRAALAKRQRLADIQFDNPLPYGIRFRLDGGGLIVVEPNPVSLSK